MKKVVLWILGISSICLGIGLLIISYNGGFEIQKKNIDISKTSSIQNIEAINITSSSANIFVTPTDGSDISIRYFGEARSNGKNDPTVTTNEVGSDLNITSGMPDTAAMYTTLGGFKLEIKIPTAYSKNIKVKSDTGDIEIDSLILKKIEVSATSGSTNLTNCKGEEQINTNSGDVKIVDSVLENNKTIVSGSGDINLFLPQNSSLSFIYNTETGIISDLFGLIMQQNDGKHMVGKANDGKYNVSVKTTSGNLNINKL
jgi:DUF4097 and DUF4098 domain-containing protein YvlB